MRVACLNQDRGISPARRKGSAVHLAAMRRAFRELGADIVVVDTSDEAEGRRKLAEAWEHSRFDLLYERYALGRDLGARFAAAHDVPFVLEVNAPLSEEESRWRCCWRVGQC